MGVHLGGHGGRQRLRWQNEPADPSDDGLVASGGEWRVRGWGCGAHLDRGDLRYQRKEARIVRRAGPVAVHAAATVQTVANECEILLPRS